MAKPVDTLRILVVDDAASMRDAVARFMRSHGVHVVVASNAVEALNILDTREIDVLVSDIQMPAQDGFWLIHEVRSRPALRSLPAIAFTGLGRAHRKRILAAGFVAHVAKDNPYTLWATIVHVARNRSRKHSM